LNKDEPNNGIGNKKENTRKRRRLYISIEFDVSHPNLLYSFRFLSL